MLATVGVLFKAVTGSFIGRAIAIGAAALVALGINNMYMQRIGGDKREAKIVKNTKKAGQQKNAKSSKVRKRIKPDTAGDSLWKQYGSD